MRIKKQHSSQIRFLYIFSTVQV